MYYPVVRQGCGLRRSDQRRQSLTGCHCVRKMNRPEARHP